MKKFSILFSLIAVFTLTGCGSTVSTKGMDIEKRDFGEITDVKTKSNTKSSSETISCTMSQYENSVSMEQEIRLYFKSNVLKSADIIIDAELDKSLLDYIDTFVDSLEEQFDDFEYGNNVKVKKTSKGATVTYSMDEDDFEGQYGSASTKNAIISELESAGYSCN